MNIFSFQIVLIIILISINTGCSETPDREPPKTVSEVLNEFVRTAPFQYINLDSTNVFEIEIIEDDIIFDVTGEGKHGEPLLGQITDFTYVKNVFYVYDMNYGAIFMIDKETGVKGPLTKSGRGPGEHLGVDKLLSNNHYIYASDRNNGRINKYSHDMITDGVLDGFHSMFVDLSDEIILTENPNSVGFIPQNPEQGIINISLIDNLSDTLATILPRIIPSGHQPDVYNNPGFSINSQNAVAAIYRPLPWIFLFDNEYNFKQTLILEYSAFNEMDIPSLDFFKPRGNEGFGGTMPISQLRYTDNGDLFISIRRELIHLSPNIDGGYLAVGRYRFHILHEKEPLWISNIFSTDNEGEFYAGNWNYLFRFVLPN